MGGIWQTKYLEFLMIGHTDKTQTWQILSKTQGDELAIIKWYGPWRQYCFFPNPDTVWNTNCLEDVRQFIHKLKAETGRR